MKRLLAKRKAPPSEAVKAPGAVRIRDGYHECYPEMDPTLEEMNTWKKAQGLENIFGEYTGKAKQQGMKKKKKGGDGGEMDKIQKILDESKAGTRKLPSLQD
jgi:hypothetical protein